MLEKVKCSLSLHKLVDFEEKTYTHKPGTKIKGFFGRVQETRKKGTCSCGKRVKITSELKELDTYYDN